MQKELHPELIQKSKNSDSGAQSNRGKQSSNNSAKGRSANFTKTVKDQSSVLAITRDPVFSAVSSDKPGDVFCRIIVEIDGHPLECIIDSGALTTVIPAKFASEYGLKLKPDKVLCQVANGKTEYTPITYACDVIVCGTIIPLELIVFDRREGLLGLDWLNTNHAYVNSFNMTLCLENRKFSLAETNIREIFFNHASSVEHIEEDSLVVSADDFAEIEEEFDHEPLPLHCDSKPDLVVLESDNLTKLELANVNALINKHKSNFAYDIHDIKQHCKLTKFKIDLTDDVPVSQRP
jgi:predicted aspartyl protease